MTSYGFHVWDFQDIKYIGMRSTDFSLKNTSEKERTEKENNAEDDMEIVEVRITNSVDLISV